MFFLTAYLYPTCDPVGLGQHWLGRALNLHSAARAMPPSFPPWRKGWAGCFSPSLTRQRGELGPDGWATISNKERRALNNPLKTLHLERARHRSFRPCPEPNQDYFTIHRWPLAQLAMYRVIQSAPSFRFAVTRGSRLSCHAGQSRRSSQRQTDMRRSSFAPLSSASLRLDFAWSCGSGSHWSGSAFLVRFTYEQIAAPHPVPTSVSSTLGQIPHWSGSRNSVSRFFSGSRRQVSRRSDKRSSVGNPSQSNASGGGGRLGLSRLRLHGSAGCGDESINAAAVRTWCV